MRGIPTAYTTVLLKYFWPVTLGGPLMTTDVLAGQIELFIINCHFMALGPLFQKHWPTVT